jgi:hypothetical protein
MIKDILLIIDNAIRAEPIIHAALAMAERQAADLTIEILTAGPLFFPAMAPLTAMYVPESELARAHRGGRRDSIQVLLRRAGARRSRRHVRARATRGKGRADRRYRHHG